MNGRRRVKLVVTLECDVLDWQGECNVRSKTVVMPKVRCTKLDCAIMEREGWAVFNEESLPEIQRDDEADIFVTDDDAIAHVMRRALAGSATHVRALVLHCQGLDERGARVRGGE